VSDLGPWEVGDSGDPQGDRDLAVARGLEAHGHIVKGADGSWDRWPQWARHVYFSTVVADEVAGVRVVAGLGKDAQDAVLAAYVLGRYAAVQDLVAGYLADRRAQG
jgi:hypothetical protein